MRSKRSRAESYINGPIKRSTRTALIRSLMNLLEEDDAVSYKERLKELDLKIARADRSKRTLVRERTQAEKYLSEVEGIMEEVEGIMEGAIGASHQPLAEECKELMEKLDGIYLSIAQLDRTRRALRKERKGIEVFAQGYVS